MRDCSIKADPSQPFSKEDTKPTKENRTVSVMTFVRVVVTSLYPAYDQAFGFSADWMTSCISKTFGPEKISARGRFRCAS
jgi:hypothetical protein